MLKDKFFIFKMKDDESILKMFYRLQVIVNYLKGLGEKVEDKDFSHKFLMCLPKKFAPLKRMIFREGLDKVKPTDVLGDIMTDAQYNDDDDDEVEEKKETKVKQEKPIAFKASSSMGKSKVESDDDDPFDDETMALLVHKMGRIMKKKEYGTRKRRDTLKTKVLCYNCNSLDHIVVDCPYEDKRFYNGDLKLEKNKKDKKEKEKKAKKSFTFNKTKKGGGYVVTWDSDDSDDDNDDSSSDDEKPIRRAIANLALSNKPSIFDITSTCLMVKPTKVKYDDSDDDSCASDGCRSDDEEDEDYFKDDLLGIIDQMSKGYKRTTQKYKFWNKSSLPRAMKIMH
jgi:hypothetical protein